MNTHRFHQDATSSPTPPPVIDPGLLAAMSDVDHARHVQRVTAWVAGQHLTTGWTDQITQAIDVLATYNENTPPGSKTIIALTGPNGAGKSSLAHHWAFDYYRRAIKDYPLDGALPRTEIEPGVRADVAPVVWVNLQARAQIPEVNDQILDFLRAPSRGPIRERTLRTVRAMERHRVKVLLIDDVHLLNTTSSTGRDVLDHIKHLNTELGEIGGTLVLVGADLHRRDLVHDPQIANRLRLLTLTALPADTPTARDDWTRVLADLEPQLQPVLPSSGPGYLTRLAKPLHTRTSGHLGELVNLLKQATISAVIQRTGTITRAHIEATPLSHRITSPRHD